MVLRFFALMILAFPCLSWHTKDLPKNPTSHFQKKFRLTEDNLKQALDVVADKILAAKLSTVLNKHIGAEFSNPTWKIAMTEAYMEVLKNEPTLKVNDSWHQILLSTFEVLQSRL